MLPNLPTDNLYKFLALSGVAMLIFAFSFPVQQIADDDRQIAAAEKANKIGGVTTSRQSQHASELLEEFKTKNNALRDKSRNLNEAEARLAGKQGELANAQKALQNKANLTETDVLAFEAQSKQYAADIDIYTKNVATLSEQVKEEEEEYAPVKVASEQADDALKISSIELEGETVLLEKSIYHMIFATVILALFGGAGAILAKVGFSAWYNKVQRFQDAVLQKQAEDTGLSVPPQIVTGVRFKKGKASDGKS